MANTDVELEQQLKEVGKKLLHPPDAVDELFPVLDQVERLLSKALIQDDLLRHSDVDVKVAVASCISEITRITAPDAPYDDDQMRDVFQLIVSSFEDLADQSGRSYIRRASILETVSKVQSWTIDRGVIYDINRENNNDLGLVKKAKTFRLRSLILYLLATDKKHNEGDSLDTYSEIGLTRVCEGTTAAMKRDDENDSGQQPADESKQAKGSQDETQQADDSKITTASSDHVDQVDKEEPCPQEEVNVDPMEGSPKSVMSNGVNVTGNEEASVDQESSKQADEDEKQQLPNATSKEDIDDSDTDDKLAKSESKPEPTPKNGEKKSDTNIDSAEPSDSSHIEGEKEAEKLESEDEKDNDVKESAISAPVQSETEKDNDDVQVSSPKAIESKSATANVSSPSQSDSLPDASRIKKAVRSKRKQVPQQDEIDTENAASPSKSETPLDESRLKKAGRSKNKDLDQEENTPLVDVKAPEISSDSDVKPQKRAGKMAVVAKEVKSPATIDSSEDDEAASDSDEEPPLKISKKLEHVNSGRKSKQSGKKAVVTKEVKLPDTIDSSEYDEAASDSDEEPPLKKSYGQSQKRKPGKKVGAGDSDAKQAKQSVKKSDAKKPKQTGKTSKQSAKKEEDSVSDSEPLKSVKKVEKRKRIVKEEDSDSDAKPLKLSAKKGNASTSGDVKSSSKKKDDGRKRASGKNVIKKAEAKTLSSDDEMDVSPKSAKKPAKGEGNLKDTSGTSSKRKRTPVKDKESDTIKYDESLVGKKVKVWWPEDKMYYEGVIESFDAAKKKHKVSYVDGDVENLYLRNQKWAIIQNFSARDKDEIAEFESEEAFPEVHKKKKSKADPAPSASQENNKDSSKKLKASGSKDNKSKAGKSKEAEVTPKTSTKTKQETSKSVNKSKGKTPQSDSKSNGPNKAKEPVKTPEKDDLRSQLAGHIKTNEEQSFANDSLKAELERYKNTRLQNLRNQVESNKSLKIESEKLKADNNALEESYLEELVWLRNTNKVVTELLQSYGQPVQTVPICVGQSLYLGDVNVDACTYLNYRVNVDEETLKVHSGRIKYVTEASKSKSKCEKKTHRNLPARSENVKRVDNPLRNLNKRNHVDSSLCVKRTRFILKSVSICKTCNECLVFGNHDKCGVKNLNSMNAKNPKVKDDATVKQVWKATGKIFASVGSKWRPTGRKFTLGDTCPLTRITKPEVVPLEKSGSVSTSKSANNVNETA
ncbi:armadillo-type fold protein [Tanacetum coccineum]